MSKNNIFRLFLKPKEQPLTDSENFYKKLEIDTLARTLWGEARGEGSKGMQAVANVIINRRDISRKLGSYWWGNDIINICQKPYQFSCWNRSDPNYPKLMNVTEKDIQFQNAIQLSKRALSGTLDDITKGSTHYHAKSVTPFWAKKETPLLTLKNHKFYRLIEI